MAGTLDLKNLKKHSISSNLRGKSILIAGVPKVGKSTFGSKIDNVLFFNFENGTEFLPLEVEPIPIQKWSEFKAYLKQLRDPEVQEKYHCIVIDTVTICAQLVERHVCLQHGVENIKDIPYGAGYGMPAAEFFSVFHEISMLGYAIVFLAHTKTQPGPYYDEKGENIQQTVPDVDKRIFAVLNGMCDLICLADKQYDPQTKTMQRVLYTDADAPDKVTGGRCCQYFPKVIPLDYKIFEKELEKAVAKIAAETHSDLRESESYVMEKRSFSDVAQEARELWEAYLNTATTEEEKEQKFAILQDIVQKVFGKPIKLSTVVPSQQELLELVVNEFKGL
jgi:hypothetical protein